MYYILAFLAIMLINLLIQFQTQFIVGYDGYFHIKFAYLLKEHGFIDKLPWLYFTIHKDFFRDHHLLFHYILVPFTFEDLTFGAKLATSLLFTLSGLAMYTLLRTLGVKYPLLWTIASFYFLSSDFIFRHNTLRVQIIFLGSFLIFVLFYLKKNYKGIFLISLLSVYLYDGFVLLFIVPLSFIISDLIINRRLYFKPVLCSLIGFASGIVINPYFPENINSIIFNLQRAINPPLELSIGAEWKPYTTLEFLTSSLPALLLLTIALFMLLLLRNHKKCFVGSFLLIALGILALVFISRRYIEYLPPVIGLLSAVVINLTIKNPRHHVALLISLFIIGTPQLKSGIEKIKSLSINPANYKRASEVIKEDSNKGDIVFNANWWEFPYLFFFNHKNYYVVGLDPIYMYKFDRNLFYLYRNITNGFVDRPIEVIKKRFKAKYIILTERNRKLKESILQEGKAVLKLKTTGLYVFKVN